MFRMSFVIRSFDIFFFFFFQAEDGIRDKLVTGVQTCALPICARNRGRAGPLRWPDHGAGDAVGAGSVGESDGIRDEPRLPAALRAVGLPARARMRPCVLTFSALYGIHSLRASVRLGAGSRKARSAVAVHLWRDGHFGLQQQILLYAIP